MVAVSGRGKLLMGLLALVVVVAAGLLVVRQFSGLPGARMAPVDDKSYVEPNGRTGEFFTGALTNVDMSIRGPKLTVRKDASGQLRTFFLGDAKLWLGLIEGEKDITGVEQVDASRLKVGQRLACFLGKANRATHVHILTR